MLLRLLAAPLALLLVLSSMTTHANELSPEPIQDGWQDGWIALFDGASLFGWELIGDVDWQVTDGTLRATEGEVGWLMTSSEFADYQLHLEFQAGSDTNSGIFLRSQKVPAKTGQEFYEVNIAPPGNPFPTGSVVNRQLADRELLKSLHPWDGEWHAVDLTIQGAQLTVKLDGKVVTEYTDIEPRLRGRIGLQFNQGDIAFRNVRLKPLETQPIFNGRDLTGWNTDRAESSRFEVTPEGELRVLDGRGQIESEASYGDFILQTECYVDGDALNSGIFFRCIPRDFMMGYECQIHNGMVDGDPSQPQDCGTGGIFRRQNARRIVAQDREWFAVTLVADGPHMAAWVNGTQVSDWTDTRTPHENPRKGLRLEPGTIAIQGHDPTTDLRFRKVRITEMPVKE